MSKFEILERTENGMAIMPYSIFLEETGDIIYIAPYDRTGNDIMRLKNVLNACDDMDDPASEIAQLRDENKKFRQFAEEAMGAMDVAQAYIRKGDIGLFSKQDALKELDILLKENPTNMEKIKGE